MAFEGPSCLVWDKNQKSQDGNKEFENPGRRGKVLIKMIFPFSTLPYFVFFDKMKVNERNTCLLFQVEPSGYETWILFEHLWFILRDSDSLNSLFPLTTFSLKIDFNKVTLPRP